MLALSWNTTWFPRQGSSFLLVISSARANRLRTIPNHLLLQNFLKSISPEIERWKFLSLFFKDFLCWRPSLNIQKHLYSVGIFNKKEMRQEVFNGHQFFRMLTQAMRMVKYSPFSLGWFEELAGPDSVTVNFFLSTPHCEIWVPWNTNRLWANCLDTFNIMQC